MISTITIFHSFILAASICGISTAETQHLRLRGNFIRNKQSDSHRDLSLWSSFLGFIRPPGPHAINSLSSLIPDNNSYNNEQEDPTQEYFDAVNGSLYYNYTSKAFINNTAQFNVDFYNTTDVSTTEGHTGSITQRKSFAWAFYIVGFTCLIGLLVMFAEIRKRKIGEETDVTLISSDNKQHFLVGSIVRRKDAIESAISRKRGWRNKLKQFTSTHDTCD